LKKVDNEWIGLAVLLCIGFLLYWTIPKIPLIQEWIITPRFTVPDLEISIIMIVLVVAVIVVFLKMTR